MSINKILIAKIIAVFGIKGFVKLLIFSDDCNKISKYQLFDDNNQPITIRLNKDTTKNVADGVVVIARINNTQDRNDAQKLVGLQIFTDRESFIKTKKNEFYIQDLIGLTVLDDNSKAIGVIANAGSVAGKCLVQIDFSDEHLSQIYHNFNDFAFNNNFFSDPDFINKTIIFYLPEII